MEGPAQLFLLRQARRRGLAAVRLLLIAEDRVVDPGYRRHLLRDAVREARAVARQALRFLAQGGSVPAELGELRQREARARRLALFRAQVSRQNLPLVPAEDRGFERRREQVRERQRSGKRRAAARRRQPSSSPVRVEPPAPRSEPTAIPAAGLEPVETLAAAAAKHGSRAGKLHLVLAERLKGAPQEVVRQYQDWILREARQAAHLAHQVLEQGGLTDQGMAVLRSPEGKAAHLASLRRRPIRWSCRVSALSGRHRRCELRARLLGHPRPGSESAACRAYARRQGRVYRGLILVRRSEEPGIPRAARRGRRKGR
jgi:hypothetical protein